MDARIKYEVELHNDVSKDIRRHNKAGNRVLVKKIYNLLSELNNHPRSGIGKPERLKGWEVETWSRRIDDRHRLIYEIHDNELVIIAISAYGHYGDE